MEDMESRHRPLNLLSDTTTFKNPSSKLQWKSSSRMGEEHTQLGCLSEQNVNKSHRTKVQLGTAERGADMKKHQAFSLALKR